MSTVFSLRYLSAHLRQFFGMSLHYTINEKLASSPVKPLCTLREFHKTDFEALECRGSLLYPTQEQAFCITPEVFCIPGSQEQWPPSHKAATPALTTSSPLQQDKTWPGGSIYMRLSVFQEKRLHALAAIFFLSGCVWISDFVASCL